jgi:hypothetical protein
LVRVQPTDLTAQKARRTRKTAFVNIRLDP